MYYPDMAGQLGEDLVRLPDGRVVPAAVAAQIQGPGAMPINTAGTPVLPDAPVGGPEKVKIEPVGMPQRSAPNFSAQPNPGMPNMYASSMTPTPSPTQGSTGSTGLSLLDLLGAQKSAKPGMDQSDVLMAIGSGMLGLSQDQGLQQLGMAGFGQISDRAKERKEEAKTTETKNKTIAALEKLNRPDLVAAVNGGLLTGADAYKIATEKPDRDKLVEAKDGSWRNPYTGEVVVAAPKGGLGLDPKDMMAQANVLRDDLRTDLKGFNAVQEAYQGIEQLYNNPGGVSDYALTVAFAKVLDPTSVVRGEEQAAIAQSGALSEAMKTQLINAFKGEGSLPPAVRQEIMEIAQGTYLNSLSTARRTAQYYTTMATDFGVNPKYLFMPEMESPGAIVPAVPPKLPQNDPRFEGFTPQDWEEYWKSLTKEQKIELSRGIQ